MRDKTLAILLAATLVAAFCSVASAAAKPTPAKAPAAKPGRFDQKAELVKYWNAPDSTVVGTVNGEKVTKGQLMKRLWLWNAPSMLGNMLQEKMIGQAAAKARVTVSSADVQARIDDMLKRMGAEDFDQLLGRLGITWYRLMDITRVNILGDKALAQTVNIPDIEFAEWIKVRQILVRFPADEKDGAKAEQVARRKIEEIAAKLKAGEDFAKLADEYSEDPGNNRDGRKQGGNLGWISRGQSPPSLEEAAFGMKVGQVSEPLKTPMGYQIIRVDKLGRDASPAEKVELRRVITDRRMARDRPQWLADLERSARLDNKLAPPPEKEPTPAAAPQPSMAPPGAKPQPPLPAPARPGE